MPPKNKAKPPANNKPAARTRNQPTQNQKRRNRANVHAAATVSGMASHGTRLHPVELIALVSPGMQTGVFHLVPSREAGKDPRESFDLSTALGQQALLYRRMQVVAPVKIEWQPLSRQVNGMVALTFRTSLQKAWSSVEDAARDPEARKGPLDRPLTLTVQPGQLSEAGKPHTIDTNQGTVTWLVTSDNAPREPPPQGGSAPLGSLRISTSVLLSEKESSATLASMFSSVSVVKPLTVPTAKVVRGSTASA